MQINKKKVAMEKRRAITQQKHVEETITAGEKEAVRAGIHVLVVVVVGGGGGSVSSQAKMRTCRDKKRNRISSFPF